jgi:hypothetical protein
MPYIPVTSAPPAAKELMNGALGEPMMSLNERFSSTTTTTWSYAGGAACATAQASETIHTVIHRCIIAFAPRHQTLADRFNLTDHNRL